MADELENGVTKSKDNCWNSIGVWASESPSCGLLRDVVHCRNCSVFSRAGRDVFERSLPEDYIGHWTRRYAEEVDVKSKGDYSIVVFRIGQEWFSLPTQFFVQVEKTSYVHKIPHVCNQLVLGLVNIKGTVRLCFSLSDLLGVSSVNLQETVRNVGEYHRFLVIKYTDQYFVFPVDEVQGIYRIDVRDLLETPTTLTKIQNELIEGVVSINQKNIAVLAAQMLFNKIEELISE